LFTSSHTVLLSIITFLMSCVPALYNLHSFPTRRSSDLFPQLTARIRKQSAGCAASIRASSHKTGNGAINRTLRFRGSEFLDARQDRKSTRLNSSHDQISYAVFCLKQKRKPPLPAVKIGT